METKVSNKNVLVTPEWVKENIDNVKVVDCTWDLTAPGDNHVPKFSTVIYFDIDKICDPNSHPLTLPHMLPSTELFNSKMKELGIMQEDQLLLYEDGTHLLASARVWWTFAVFGHHKVHILDGGFRKWPKDVVPKKKFQK